MQDEPRLDEQIISKITEAQLSNQIAEAQELEVEVRTDLLKVAQGQADSITIKGQGLILNSDVRVKGMEVRAQHVDVNPFSVIFNKLEFNRPVDAAGHIVLTETDLNQILNSDDFCQIMPPLTLTINNQVVTLKLQPPMGLTLLENQQMIFQGHALIQGNDVQQINFSATIFPRTAEQPILIESFGCQKGQAISLELATALLQKLNELIKLPYLQWEGITFQIQEFSVRKSELMVQIDARVKELPQIK